MFVSADEKFIPTWETFFESLSLRINDQTSSHRSVLNEFIDNVGGPMQLPVEYPKHVSLQESDLVEPVIVSGFTDIRTTSERQTLLELRAESANLLRRLGRCTCDEVVAYCA